MILLDQFPQHCILVQILDLRLVMIQESHLTGNRSVSGGGRPRATVSMPYSADTRARKGAPETPEITPPRLFGWGVIGSNAMHETDGDTITAQRSKRARSGDRRRSVPPAWVETVPYEGGGEAKRAKR